MNWLFKFFKGGKTISQAIREFFEMNGRMPNARETLKMKDIFRQSQSNVIEFPKDRITDWWKPRPGKGKKDLTTEDVLKGPVTVESPKGTQVWDLGKQTEGEVILKETPLTKDASFRIKQGHSTKIKLNSVRENEQFAKDLINRKNTLTSGSSQAEVINVLGPLQTLQRLNRGDKLSNDTGGVTIPIENTNRKTIPTK